MSSLRQTLILGRREFLQRAQSRAFLVTMGILAALILAAGPVLSAIDSEDEAIAIGVVGETPTGFDTDLQAAAVAFEAEVELQRPADLTSAESLLSDGELDVLLVDGQELVWDEDDGFFTTRIIQTALTLGARRAAAESLGLTDADQARLQMSVELPSRFLVEPDPDEEARLVAAFASLMVLYVAILVFGQFVAMGTVQEKQNRVVEVILAKVTPSQVLIGKVVGIGLLGLAQLIVLGVAGLVTLNLVDSDLDLPSIGAETVAFAILWFLLGYTLYAFVYAALGATVSRQEDLQGVLVAPLVLLLPGFFIAQLATADPDMTVARFGALFPFWTPMIMPTRTASGDAGLGEVVLAVVLIVATIYALIRVGSRVYAGALLRTGGRVGLRDAWRSARE